MADEINYSNGSTYTLADAYQKLAEARGRRDALAKGEQVDQNGTTLNVAPAVPNVNTKENASFFKRVIGTVDEAIYNVESAFLSLGEGVVDAIAGLFGEGAEDFIKRDFSQELMDFKDDNWWANLGLGSLHLGASIYNQTSGESIKDYSYVKDADEKIQKIIYGVENGLGSSLGGMALSSIPYAGVALYGMGAGGATLEETLNDPNYNGNYWGAVGYGMLSGATEAAVEQLSSLAGKGLNKLAEKFPESMGWLKNGIGAFTGDYRSGTLGNKLVTAIGSFVSEGAEEVVGELTDPLYRSIYSGNSVEEEYSNLSAKEVAEAFYIGGLSALVMNGATAGVQTVTNNVRYGKENLQVLEKANEVQQKLTELKQNENQYSANEYNKLKQQYVTELSELAKQFNGNEGKVARSQNALNEMVNPRTKINIKGLTKEETKTLQDVTDAIREGNNIVIDNKIDTDKLSKVLDEQFSYDTETAINKAKINLIKNIAKENKNLAKNIASDINSIEMVDNDVLNPKGKKGKRKVDGRIVYDEKTDTYKIQISKNISPEKSANFLLAHELGHYISSTNDLADIKKEVLNYLKETKTISNNNSYESMYDSYKREYDNKQQNDDEIDEEIFSDFLGNLFKENGKFDSLFVTERQAKKLEKKLSAIRKTSTDNYFRAKLATALSKLRNAKEFRKERPIKWKAKNSTTDLVKGLRKANKDSNSETDKVILSARLGSYQKLINKYSKRSEIDRLNSQSTTYYYITENDKAERIVRSSGNNVTTEEGNTYSINQPSDSVITAKKSFLTSAEKEYLRTNNVKLVDSTMADVKEGDLMLPTFSIVKNIRNVTQDEADSIGSINEQLGQMWKTENVVAETEYTWKQGTETVVINNAQPLRINENSNESLEANSQEVIESNETIRERQAENDYSGYGTFTIDGQKIKVGDFVNALSVVDGYAINFEEYRTEGNDYSDGYLKKRYVNKLNNICEKMLDFLRNEVFDDSNYEAVNRDGLEQLINGTESFELQSFIDNLGEVMSEVDSGDYPNGEYPDYDYVSELSDYLDDIVNNGEEYLEQSDEEQEKITDDNVNNQNLVANNENVDNNIDEQGGRDYEDEFRRIQEESERKSFESIKKQGTYITSDEGLRSRLSSILKGWLDSRGINSSNTKLHDLKSRKNTQFNMYENIDGKIFHDVFGIVRKYTPNGELVDLHDDYSDATCYLSEDGLSGFAITKTGDLISVFNGNTKRGFLSAISTIVKKDAKTLDCFISPNQNLQEMYSKEFGFKTASIMDHNMEFDHDSIAKNHNNPKVAFMVNTTNKVETKEFNKDQYDDAHDHQLTSLVKLDEVKIGDNGKIVRDENTEPYFIIAEGKLNEAKEQFAAASDKLFKSIADKYGVSLDIKEYNGKTLQNPSMKSVSSFADRLYRNHVNGRNPYSSLVKDHIRGTFIFDESSIKKIPNIIKDLSKYIYKIDVKNRGDYKGIHLNLNYEGINVEIQLHTRQSWELKAESDLFYEKYRSVDTKKMSEIDKSNYDNQSKEFSKRWNSLLSDNQDFNNLRKSVSEISTRSFHSSTGGNGNLTSTNLPSSNENSSLGWNESPLSTRPSGQSQILDSSISNTSLSDNSISQNNEVSTEIDKITLAVVNFDNNNRKKTAKAIIQSMEFNPSATSAYKLLMSYVTLNKKGRAARDVKKYLNKILNNVTINGKTFNDFLTETYKNLDYTDAEVNEFVKQHRADVIDAIKEQIDDIAGTDVKKLYSKLSDVISKLYQEVAKQAAMNKESRRATLEIAKQIFWAKNYLKANRASPLDGYIRNFVERLSKLRFTTTSSLRNEARNVINDMYNEFWNNKKLADYLPEDETTRETAEQIFEFFKQRVKQGNLTSVNAFGRTVVSGLDTIHYISDINPDIQLDMTEARAAVFIFKLLRKVGNVAQGDVANINGKKVDTRKRIQEEITDIQDPAKRSGKNGTFRKMLFKYFSSIGDMQFLFNYYAHANDKSVFKDIYKELQNGQYKTYQTYMDLMTEAVNYFKDHKDVLKHLEKNDVEYKGHKMKVGELISLYMTLKTDNAISHITQSRGGVKITQADGNIINITGNDFLEYLNSDAVLDKYIKQYTDAEKKVKHDGDITRVKKINNNFELIGRYNYLGSKTRNDQELLEYSFIKKAIVEEAQKEVRSLINEEFNDVIDIIEKTFQRTGKIYQEASENMNGFSYELKDYFYPTRGNALDRIRDLGSTNNATLDTIQSSYSPSFSKEIVKGSTNTLQVTDVISTFNSFMNQLSVYAGVTQSISEVNKLLRKNITSNNLNRQMSFIEYMQTYVDPDFSKRMDRLFKAMQGISTADYGTIEKTWESFRKLVAQAALAGNIKVIISQTTSYPMAFAYLSTSSLLKGAAVSNRSATSKGLKDFDWLMEHSPYTKFRYFDGSEVVNAESMGAISNNPVTNILMKPIKFTDKFTYTKLWFACQYEAKGDLDAAVKLFEEVAQATQPQYNPLFNGDITRSNNVIVKSMLMFTSVTRKYMSRLMESFYNLAVLEKGTPEYQKAKRFCAKTTAGFLTATAFMTALATLLKWLRGKYDDKDEDEVLKDILVNNFGSNIVGLLPAFKDIYNYLLNDYDINITGFANIEGALDIVAKYIPTLMNAESSDGARRAALFNTVNSICTILGIPSRNLYTDVEYIAGLNDKVFKTDIILKMKNVFYNTSNSSLTTLLNNYSKKGKEDKAQAVIEMKFENYISGKLDDDASKEITRLYMNESLKTLPSSIEKELTINGQIKKLNNAERKMARSVYNMANELYAKMIKSSAYNSLTDEEKALALNKLYATYYDLAKYAVTDDKSKYELSKLASLADYIDMSKYAVYLAKIAKIENSAKLSRKALVGAYINKLRLSAKEKYLLYYLAGYKVSEDNQKMVSSYLVSQGATRAYSNSLFA